MEFLSKYASAFESYRGSVGGVVAGGKEERGDKWVEIISWEPRASVFHNFLSKEECEHLISIAGPHMARSKVLNTATGISVESSGRTSSGAFLKRGSDDIIRNIEKRIADFTCIPVENGTGLQVLRYEVGQKIDLHHDYFYDGFNTKNGGPRIATILMYLTDVEEGGETVFPAAKGNISSVPLWDKLSAYGKLNILSSSSETVIPAAKGNLNSVPLWDKLTKCGKGGLSIKPKMGDALLFWNMKPDGTMDQLSLHGGCPVIKGNKWASTKWMHLHEFRV